jgi:Pectate lyase superfamily protein
MKKSVFYVLIAVILGLSAVIVYNVRNSPDAPSISNKNLAPVPVEDNRNFNELSVNVKSSIYGAKGNGITDDTQPLQKAIDSAANSGGGVVSLPVSTYRITKTLYIPDNVTLIGESQGTSGTIIQYEGSGFALQSTGDHKRINIENMRVVLNGKNNGIQLGDVSSKLGKNVIPGEMGLRHITVTGIGKGKIGIKLSNASHVNMLDVRSGYGKTTGGHGLFIFADKYNSGVIVAYDCTFGRVDATKVGLEIDGSVNLDTFTFNGCYFGGELPIRIGMNTYVRNVNFVGTHIEARDTDRVTPNTKMVELYNVLGGNFIGVSLIGFGERNNRGFVFRGDVEKVNILGVEANRVMGAVYANEGANLSKDSIIQEARLTNGANAVQFRGEFNR